MNSNTLLTADPDILGGQPVFTSTRVPVESLFDQLETGVSLDEFLADFSTVTRALVIAVLDFTNSCCPLLF
ncbi:MAG: DUF433 domain-containing protein [Hymenobacter sp.]|nr:MAG: DUF433 domain-containing protein [Hymenobacter sp.]